MAYVAADYIIERLRELLQDGDGDIRQIVATRLAGDLPPGLSVEEQRRRGINTEKPIEVTLTGLRPHPQTLTRAGNIRIYLLGVTIRVVRTLAVHDQVTDTLRDDVQAQSVIDASAIDHVLSWPNNLTQTEGANATNIKDATYVGSTARVAGTTGGAMDITTEHRFELTVTSSPGVA